LADPVWYFTWESAAEAADFEPDYNLASPRPVVRPENPGEARDAYRSGADLVLRVRAPGNGTVRGITLYAAARYACSNDPKRVSSITFGGSNWYAPNLLEASSSVDMVRVSEALLGGCARRNAATAMSEILITANINVTGAAKDSYVLEMTLPW
jgi:hypothetical protein